MKIAIVSPYPPSKTTLNEYAYHLINHFNTNEKVSEIVVLTDQLENDQEYKLENDLVKVTIDPVWKFNSFKNLFSIHSAIKKHKPDIVFYNIQFLSFGDNKVAATLGLLSPWVSKIFRFPSVVLLHNIIETVDLEKAGITGNRFLGAMYGIFGTILTKIILQANLVAFTIPKYVDIIVKKYKVRNVVHMPHGTFEIPEKPDFQKKITGIKKVMTFGKFGTYKKVENMVEAVKKVRKRMGERIQIVIAGTDNPNVKGYLKSVEDKYQQTPDLHFTGYVDEADVPRIFKESTTVVFPYTSTTGSSGVLHQAGSYGKSAILPLLGDLRELVEEEGYAGSYFDPQEVESLADAIYNVLSDDKFRLELEQKNYEAASSLSMEKIANDYVGIFMDLALNTAKLSVHSSNKSFTKSFA